MAAIWSHQNFTNTLKINQGQEVKMKCSVKSEEILNYDDSKSGRVGPNKG